MKRNPKMKGAATNQPNNCKMKDSDTWGLSFWVSSITWCSAYGVHFSNLLICKYITSWSGWCHDILPINPSTQMSPLISVHRSKQWCFPFRLKIGLIMLGPSNDWSFHLGCPRVFEGKNGTYRMKYAKKNFSWSLTCDHLLQCIRGQWKMRAARYYFTESQEGNH